jgi:peroxidase
MYSGYNSSINPSVDLFFANVAYRYGHSAVNSFILRIDENGNQAAEGHLILRNAFFGDICSEIRKYGVESILRGFAAQNDQNVDTTFVDDIRNHLPLAGPGGHFDLSAIGIQRTRELGIPDYNTCRKAFNLTTAKYWSDVTSNIQLQRQLSNLYPNIDDADVYVAAFVEDHTDANSAVGPLMRKSIMDQFTRLRDGDRFWYEAPGILTTEEHAELLNFTYGTMIQMNTKISHFPSDPFVAVHPSYFANGIQQAKKASQKAYGSGSVSVLGNLQLSWTIQSDISVIDFIFESNSSGWYGFGLGSNMLGAEIFFCTDSGNGSFTVIDSWR